MKTPTTTLSTTAKLAAIKEAHAQPGLKDADLHDLFRSKHKVIRSTSTTPDLDRQLKNAQRQARRRANRLQARLLANDALALAAIA